MLLVTTWSLAFSQTEKPADTVKHSTVSKYIPTGIRLGTDVITIIRTQTSDKFSGWEMNADVDFHRYYLAVDYGNWARTDSIRSGSLGYSKGKYNNHGNYFRIGVDINFMLKDPDRNMFFLGFRYGHSSFEESLSYSYQDQYYNTISKNITATGLTGHWVELTTGLRIKIFPGFWMGYTGRLKFSPGVSGTQGQLAPYDIPGYGLAAKTLWWGFNYQLFWRIPFRKAPKVTPSK